MAFKLISRRTTVMLLIQQVFEGTVERRVTDTLKWVFSDESIVGQLDSIKDTFWPGGKWRSEPPVRTAQQMMDTRIEAQSKLLQLMPDLAGGVVGKANARRGAERLFLVFQNRRLNQHLCYQIFDEIVYAVLEEV